MSKRWLRLPLMHQPGEVWEYSVSTDVLGRVVEVVAGGKLGDFLRERIFGPLGMDDTAFFIPPRQKLSREAKPMSPESTTKPRRRSEAHDRAAAIRIGRRRAFVDDRRLCALPRHAQRRRRARRRSASSARERSGYMASDHLGTECRPQPRAACAGPRLRPRLLRAAATRLAPTPGSVGDYFWGGAAGTSFRISPQDSPVRDFHGAGTGLSRAL